MKLEEKTVSGTTNFDRKCGIRLVVTFEFPVRSKQCTVLFAVKKIDTNCSTNFVFEIVNKN